MGTPRVVLARATLMFLTLLLQPFLSARGDGVSYELEMGGPIRQQYNCIFTGIVTLNGKVCPGARVTLDFFGKDEERTETVDADDLGRYRVQTALEGTEQTQSTWRLTAKAAVIGATPVELEGRLIFTSEP